MYAEGALALLLRLSCVAAAPLRARRLRAGWRFDASPALATLQAGGMTILNLAILTSLILDYCQEPRNRLRVGTDLVTAVIWISDALLVMAIASLAVYTGPAQMQFLSRVLNQLEQLNVIRPSAKTETVKSILMVIMLTWVVAIMMMDFIFYYQDSSKNGTVCILSLNVAFLIGNLVWWLTVLRWALTVELVTDAAAAVNHRLRALRFVKAQPTASVERFLSKPRSIGTLLTWISDPAVARQITRLGTRNSTYPPQVKVMIRRLILSYEKIGDIMRQMNDNNGWLLMVILTAVFMKLVVTPHYMLKYLLDEESNVVFDVMLAVNWGLFLMAILILSIEPCHRMHLERELTVVLLRQMIVEGTQLSKELEPFTKHVMLNSPRFMPLGIYTLDRPLMAMMLRGVTTYLIIILQFQTLSVKPKHVRGV